MSLTERVLPSAQEEVKDSRKVRSNSEHNHGGSSGAGEQVVTSVRISDVLSPRSNIQKYANEYK